MKAIIKLGSVFKSGSWDNDTYFECDEEWEEETENVEQLTKKLKKEFSGVYDIYTKSNGVIVACVY